MIFFKRIYSQNYETGLEVLGVLEVLEIKILFELPNHGGKIFTDFFKKFSPWILQFIGGISVSCLKRKEKGKKSLNIYLYHYQRFSKSPRGNSKLENRVTHHIKKRAD